MWKKIAINVFYNLGIIVSIFGITWGYNNSKYLAIGLFVLTGAFFLYLKLQLMKETRNEFRNRK